MSFRKAYRRYRTLWVSLIACTGFLLLAGYGWGVNWREMLLGLALLLGLLAGLMLLAAILGFILFKVRQWRGSRNDRWK